MKKISKMKKYRQNPRIIKKNKNKKIIKIGTLEKKNHWNRKLSKSNKKFSNK